jgi:hypothetical protein
MDPISRTQAATDIAPYTCLETRRLTHIDLDERICVFDTFVSGGGGGDDVDDDDTNKSCRFSSLTDDDIDEEESVDDEEEEEEEDVDEVRGLRARAAAAVLVTGSLLCSTNSCDRSLRFTSGLYSETLVE